MKQKHSSVHLPEFEESVKAVLGAYEWKGSIKKPDRLKISIWCQLWRYTLSMEFPGGWMETAALRAVQVSGLLQAQLKMDLNSEVYILLDSFILFNLYEMLTLKKL